ncbi:MAG TPA: Ig-like domain-containing protein [Actinophytocola sp.]|nr:Ig-like domain-containing protein [Actinophytocola sp.]HEV2782773.1 Ig-like domain-containing protein [Actinophytocola sp.]
MTGRAVWAVVGLVLVGLAGCTSAPAEQGAAPPGSTSQGPPVSSPAPEVTPVGLAIVPGDKAVDVAPGEPVRVTATGGRLTEVVVTNQDGKPVGGQLAADGTSWQSTEPLGYGKSYTATATGQGADGKTAAATASFSTVTPRRQTNLSISPLDGQTVGVGLPLAFYFDTAIADKAAAERAIKITTTPAVEGAFYWFDDRQVQWRPEDYWKPGTKITVNAAVYGKDLGNGVYGREDRAANITVGDSVIIHADGQTHQATVAINGVVARTIPISMGKRGYETPQGTFVVMSEHTNYIMDSSTYGVPVDSPQGYRTKVAVATRLSNSGIFYHSAPWSVRQQGNSNVSHGCINMSTENSRWLQEVSNRGDIFIVSNSGGQRLEPTDGIGVWQIPWAEWRKGGKR